MSALVLAEPLLEFAARQRHVDPRFGIASYGPAARGSDDAPRAITVGLVGEAGAIASAQQWLERCAAGLEGKAENKYPNLWMPFPGFEESSGFGTSLVFTERLQRAIRPCDLRRLAIQDDAAVEQAVELYLTEIEALAQAAQPRVIICVMPTELLTADEAEPSTDVFPEAPNRSAASRFHDELKAKAMRYRVPLQLLRPSTFDPKLGRGTARRGPLQDEATRAWNFLTALYYKAGGTPWRLVRDDSDLESCYVGISFYWRLDGEAATSVAQVFNERGDGVVVRGGPAIKSTRDKQLHLREEDAYQLLRDALRAFRTEHKHLPARVVAHKTTDFDERELAGMIRAVEDQDVESGEFLWISEGSGVRLFRDGQQPPLRGTMIQLEQDHAVLYTRGAVEYYGTYPGQYVPRPIALRAAYAERSMTGLAAEVMALSKMNWNSTQFDGQLPVTIRTARDVSEVVRHLPEGAPVEPRYAFYM